MAGELLVRVLDWCAFERLAQARRISRAAAAVAFEDGGTWSLQETSGAGWVLIDRAAPAFLEEAPFVFEGHHAMQGLALVDAETTVLVVPAPVLLDWSARIDALPLDSLLRTRFATVTSALSALMHRVLADDTRRLTIQSLL